jgi:hypothetical protein
MPIYPFVSALCFLMIFDSPCCLVRSSAAPLGHAPRAPLPAPLTVPRVVSTPFPSRLPALVSLVPAPRPPRLTVTLENTAMDNTPARSFFLQPNAAPQILYEALRAVCVDGCRQKDVADRFGYDYAAFRQQVTRFRARCAAGQPPPFFPHRLHRARRPNSQPNRSNRR